MFRLTFHTAYRTCFPARSWQRYLIALAAQEVAFDLVHQLRLVPGDLTPQGIAFDVLSEQLVWVELRTIAGEKNEPNPPFIFLDPVLQPVGARYWVTVNNELDAAMTLAEQAPEKLQKNLGGEALLKDPEV